MRNEPNLHPETKASGFRSHSRTAVLALMLSLPALAQLDITGKVIGTDGKGIPGVKVALKKTKASALTDADGVYRLDVASGAAEKRQGSVSVTPSFRLGRIAFGVPEDGTRVSIRILDPAGRSARPLVDERLDRGSYEVVPFPSGSSPGAAAPGAAGSGLAILRIRIGSQSHVLKVFGGMDAAPVNVSADRAMAAMRAAPKASAAAYDTMLVTKDGYTPDYKRINSLTGTHDFFLVRPEAFWGDPTTAPVAKLRMTYVFLNRTNGKYADNQIFWKFTGADLATGQQLPVQSGNLKDHPTFDIPSHKAGRVTFHLGSATGEYSDFMEQTVDHLGWHGNTTRVDAYVFPVAMRMICGDGAGRDELLGEKYEVFYLGRERFFAKYKAAMPLEFQPTVDSGKGIRIVAPGKGEKAFGPKDKYAGYFNAYFAELGLTGAGATSEQAFACAGPIFGENAQLCGAVNRHVAHLPKSQWHNPENFYQQAPANYYARFFHDHSFQEKAYGFAYDDAANMAAYAECAKPKTLLVAIGF
jgi:hypothetical protein